MMGPGRDGIYVRMSLIKYTLETTVAISVYGRGAIPFDTVPARRAIVPYATVCNTECKSIPYQLHFDFQTHTSNCPEIKTMKIKRERVTY